MEVLEYEDDRTFGGQLLEERPPSAEQLLGIRLSAAQAEQGQHGGLDPAAVGLLGNVFGHHGSDTLARGVLAISLCEAGALADHLAEGPEGEALAVRRASAVVEPEILCLGVDVVEELAGQAALPDPRRPDDRHQPCPLFPRRGVVQLLQERQLLGPSDEWCLWALLPPAPANAAGHTDRPPRWDGCALALEELVTCLLEHDAGGRRSLGGFPDQDCSRRSHGLESGGRVDEVPSHHALIGRGQGDGRFAGEDPGPGLDARAHGSHRLDQVHSGANGPLCVVLVGDRDAPYSHDRVADELLDRAAISLDHLACRIEVGAERLAHLFGIPVLRERREAHQVSEQDRHDTTLGDGAGDLRCAGAGGCRGG
ncbi:MAG TPA: hypothetical protein VIA02_02410 [Candidatus Limnocylindria bacterium]